MDYKEEDDDGEFHSYYLPPPSMTRWEAFSNFLWNPDTKEFMGRNGLSWSRVGIFYVVLYAFLAAFFGGMLHVFMNTLDENQPKWILEENIIGTSAGLAYRPRDLLSSVITFSPGDPATWDHYTKSLSDFLEPYDDVHQTGDVFRDCDGSDDQTAGSLCTFNIRQLGENCVSDRFFGYSNGKPCLIIKLNKIWGWIPEPYSPEDNLDNLPEDVQKLVKDNSGDPHIWVTCGGYKERDRNMTGSLNYYPKKQGFPVYYYPYRNHPGYLSPLLAVEFVNPPHGEQVKIECKAWAKNIVHMSKEQQGSVMFDLLVN